MGNRSLVQAVAAAFGAIYLVAGVLGFFNHAILGIFQVNLLHNLVHIGIGIGGLAAASSVANSKTFCRVAGVILLLLGLIGFGVANPFGLLYIGGADIALHLVTGGLLAYFGFAAPVSTRSA
ncbi:MAG: hypothetical protein QOJ33_654 [Chloroflexota bacterium]|jgi:hypothetical protein|nr:hypothetical protein [Chloroflexota bacterium]MEA2667720.1 hypothetical protein [Chloroflexota bacterium]